MIDFVSSYFPSVANQWSVGSRRPYPILKIRHVHLLAIYNCQVQVLFKYMDTDCSSVGAKIFCGACIVQSEGSELRVSIYYCMQDGAEDGLVTGAL